MTAQERENRIAALNEQIARFYYAGRVDLAREAIVKRDSLIKGRSKKTVARMEKERGLV